MNDLNAILSEKDIVCENIPGYGEVLFKRTKAFALSIVELYFRLARDTVSQTLGRQALLSGTSVGAHYREAYQARSIAEVISKLEETTYWLELLQECERSDVADTSQLLKEAEELKRIFVTSVRTAKLRKK